MNKIFVYGLSILFVSNAIYHLSIWYQCIYLARLTKGMVAVVVIIPIVFLSLAYTVGNGLIENVILTLVASLSMISQVAGRGISEKGIYYWTKTGLNRLAKWEDIKQLHFDQSKSHLEKIRFSSYARYPDQYYQSEKVEEIYDYIQRRI